MAKPRYNTHLKAEIDYDRHALNAPTELRENCQISFGAFRGAFANPKITMSDIDGIIEYKDYYLINEVKFPQGELQTAQELLLKRLTKKLGADCSVAVVVETERRSVMNGPWGAEAKEGHYQFVPQRIRFIQGGEISPRWNAITPTGFVELMNELERCADQKKPLPDFLSLSKRLQQADRVIDDTFKF